MTDKDECLTAIRKPPFLTPSSSKTKSVRTGSSTPILCGVSLVTVFRTLSGLRTLYLSELPLMPTNPHRHDFVLIDQTACVQFEREASIS